MSCKHVHGITEEKSRLPCPGRDPACAILIFNTALELLISLPDRAYNVAWTPDGDGLVLASSLHADVRTLQTITLPGREESATTRVQTDQLAVLARALAAHGLGHLLTALPCASVLPRCTSKSTYLSPSGACLIFTAPISVPSDSHRYEVWLFQLEPSGAARLHKLDLSCTARYCCGLIKEVAWHPDNRHVAILCHEQATVCDTEGQVLQRISLPKPMRYWVCYMSCHLRWSALGEQLYVGLNDRKGVVLSWAYCPADYRRVTRRIDTAPALLVTPCLVRQQLGAVCQMLKEPCMVLLIFVLNMTWMTALGLGVCKLLALFFPDLDHASAPAPAPALDAA